MAPATLIRCPAVPSFSCRPRASRPPPRHRSPSAMTPPDDTARRHEPARLDRLTGLRRRHTMPHGAEIEDDGTTRFRLWAPSAAQVSLVLESGDTLPMRTMPLGWWTVTARAEAGTRYRFKINDKL